MGPERDVLESRPSGASVMFGADMYFEGVDGDLAIGSLNLEDLGETGLQYPDWISGGPVTES